MSKTSLSIYTLKTSINIPIRRKKGFIILFINRSFLICRMKDKLGRMRSGMTSIETNVVVENNKW